ncbi:uncharacterized protein [Diadema antillarum]|uniref:uncharacterized protein n=1 Tax=Diadema antillarum TaxID=105358 RepID=UPI003A899985
MNIMAHHPVKLICLLFYISLTSAESVCFQRDTMETTCSCTRPPPTVPDLPGCIQTTTTQQTTTPTDESTTIDTTSQSTTDPTSTVQTTEGQARTDEPQVATTVSVSTTDATSTRQTTVAEPTSTEVALEAETTSKATTEASTQPTTQTSTQASTEATTEATSEQTTKATTMVTEEVITAETTKLTTESTTDKTTAKTTQATTEVTEATTVETTKATTGVYTTTAETTELTTEATTKATTETTTDVTTAETTKATTEVAEATTAETTEITTEATTKTTTDGTTAETTKATTEVTEATTEATSATTAETTKGITTDPTPTIKSTVTQGVIQNSLTSEFSVIVESRNNVQRKRRRRATLPNNHPNVVELQRQIESAVTNLTEVVAANSTVQSAETSDDNSTIRTTLRLTVQHDASVVSADLSNRLNTAITSINGVTSVSVTDLTGGQPACSADNCINGTCVADNSGVLTCSCQSGYSGPTCSSADPTNITTLLLLAILLPVLALLVLGFALVLTVLVIRKTRRKNMKLPWFPAERMVTTWRDPRDRADGIPGGQGKPGEFNPYTSTRFLAAYGLYTKRYSSRPEKFANKSSKGNKLNGHQGRNLHDVYSSNGLSPIPKPLQGNRQNGDIRRDSTVHYNKGPSPIPLPLRGKEANGYISSNPNTVYYSKKPSSSPLALKGSKPNGDLSRNPYTAHYGKGPSSFPQDIRGNKASSDISRNPYTVYYSNKLPLLPRAVTGKKPNGDSRQDPFGTYSRSGLPSYAHPLQLTGLNLAVSPRQAYALEAISYNHRPRARQVGINRSGYHYDQPYGRKASLVDGSSPRQDFLVSSEYF